MLVRRGDPAALARALGDLLADPDRRAELSAAGRRAAAAYDWQVLARRILAVYETVVPPGGGGVTAEDSADYPGVPPARRQARTSPRRPTQPLAFRPVTPDAWILLPSARSSWSCSCGCCGRSPGWAGWWTASTGPGWPWTPSCSGAPGWPRSSPAPTRRPWGRTGRSTWPPSPRMPAAPSTVTASWPRTLLGRELRELPDDLPGVPTALRTDLEGTAIRVSLARRFYNDAVRDTRALRRSRLARVLRLHARRPLPRYFDIDDRARAGRRPGAGRPAR